MTQEDKELLLKDLCARLPYGVKIQVPYEDGSGYFDETVWEVNNDGPFHINGWGIEYEYVKPYLFPLSSMTEKQYDEFIIISGWEGNIENIRRGKFSCIGFIGLDYIYDTIDWLNKNHFDYRNLIENSLAIDATGKDIY